MVGPIDPKTIQLTSEGLEELQAELKELKEIKLPQAVERVAKAREYGDLSENAEYHSAKEDQALIEARLSEIEDILDNAQLVKQTHSTTHIGMGSQVIVTAKGKKLKFVLVGEFEADPTENKISSVSPLGQALMGKKKGDRVKVQAPAGEVEYTISEIK